MRFLISLPVTKTALAGLLLVGFGGCACDQERASAKAEAKARVGARVGDSPTAMAAKEAIAADKLHADRKLLGRVWTMPWREAQLRIADHATWQARAQVSYEKIGGGGLSLDEEVELNSTFKPEALDLSVSNDGGFFQRIVYSNGVLYKKYQNGRFVASKDLEAKRLKYADEAFATSASAWSLLGRHFALRVGGGAEIAGRSAWCYSIIPNAKPEAFVPDQLQGVLRSLKGWRETLELSSIEGKLCVDQATAVPLELQLKAEARRSFEGGEGKLELSVKAGFSSIGRAPMIAAPEEYLNTLRRKRRKRPATEFLRRGGVQALPKPDAGASP